MPHWKRNKSRKIRALENEALTDALGAEPAPLCISNSLRSRNVGLARSAGPEVRQDTGKSTGPKIRKTSRQRQDGTAGFVELPRVRRHPKNAEMLRQTHRSLPFLQASGLRGFRSVWTRLRLCAVPSIGRCSLLVAFSGGPFDLAVKLAAEDRNFPGGADADPHGIALDSGYHDLDVIANHDCFTDFS